VIDLFDIGEPAHSPLGPSGGERWMECPGSYLATVGMPDRETVFSAEGNAAHLLSEWARDLDTPCKHWIGTEITIGEFKFTVDQEMAESVQEFVDWCNEVEGEALVEVRVHYEDWVENGWGTLDDARLRDFICVITDLKFGKGHEVRAWNNTQLKLYALGVYHDWKHLYQFDKFILRICQPRKDIAEEFEISLADLLRWADEVVRPAALRTLDPDAPFKAGDWCTFCKLRGTCATRATAMMQTVSGQEFANLDELLDDNVAEAARKRVGELTGDQLAKVLLQIDAIKKWTKEVVAHAMGEIQKGHAIGEFKLVEGRARRVWADNEFNTEQNLMNLGLPEDRVWTKKIISPSQAEKALGKKKPGLQDMIKKPTGKPTLVPGTDPRQPMSIDAVREFADLGEDDDDE
jgi:uncharacterized protein DUF2800